MLDDTNVIKQRDPQDALGVAGLQYQQAEFEAEVINQPADGANITSVVVAGMGGSALAALLVKAWLKEELGVPLEIVRNYNLPSYAGQNTLVIASSYSGNTEETLSVLSQAESKNSKVSVIASGGKLAEYATSKEAVPHVILPGDLQPRMAVILNLRALLALLVSFDIVSKTRLDDIASASDWLKTESAKWDPAVPTDQNYAKQLALESAGKTAVLYGGSLTGALAYKWKIGWNENAKNTAFWNEYPEFNHNEFIGWTSHPVEKPFAIFDLVSNLEHSQILKRFEVSDRLLSGKRPKATVINLQGETTIQQLLWGSILADYASIYLAILNGVNPTPVDLIEKLKAELE